MKFLLRVSLDFMVCFYFCFFLSYNTSSNILLFPFLQMYASASASEVENVRTALLSQFEEVKMKQQLQFQEEIELLKCQSEVLLEQQIAQLKVRSN